VCVCARALSLSLSLARALSLSLSLSHTHTHTRAHTHKYWQQWRRIPQFSMYLPLSLSLSHTYTHTHTHTTKHSGNNGGGFIDSIGYKSTNDTCLGPNGLRSGAVFRNRYEYGQSKKETACILFLNYTGRCFSKQHALPPFFERACVCWALRQINNTHRR
jgi:hypothetical protein